MRLAEILLESIAIQLYNLLAINGMCILEKKEFLYVLLFMIVPDK